MDLTNFYQGCIRWATTSGIRLIIAIVVLFVGWKIINRALNTLNNFLLKKNVDKTLISFSHAFADLGLKFLLVVFLMDYVGIATTGIAALLASAGLAVGLALQGSLANFAGGVIILFLRPFKVSDFIECGNYSGVVERITIFYTHVLTPDNKEILIPNGTLSNGTLINYSSQPLRRVDLTFSIGYGDDIIKAKTILNSILEEHQLVLDSPESFVGVCEHAASSINIVVRAWCLSENYWTIYFDLLETVKIAFDNANISIPYPQMDIHMNK